MEKSEIVKIWCAQQIGDPYIYGGTGARCTPDYRKARAAQYPQYKARIFGACPRLSGRAETCDGCKWADAEGRGKPAYDCAMFARRAMEAVGIELPSGANSQWQKTRWAEKGELSTLPRNRVALVYRWDADHMGHAGVYQGNGEVIHAKGHDAGVVRQKLDSAGFTHWGIPIGLYGGGEMDHPELKNGDQGAVVYYLQTLLCDIGETLKVDGIFGAKTEKALKHFQMLEGLDQTGIANAVTWAALERATGHDDQETNDDLPLGELLRKLGRYPLSDIIRAVKEGL